MASDGRKRQVAHGGALDRNADLKNHGRKWSEARQEEIVAQAKEKLGEMFSAVLKLSDPVEQVLAFYRAIESGMPGREAAGYFLGIDSDDEYREFLRQPDVGDMVRHFEGDLALRQYRKVTKDGNGLEWLRANRKDQWKNNVDVTSGGERIAIQVLYADADPNATETAPSTTDDPEGS